MSGTGPIEIQNDSLTRLRVLIGDSVFESADVSVREDWLHIEFDADDLENVAVNLRDLAEQEATARS